MDDTTPPPPAVQTPPKPSFNAENWRKITGRIISVLAILAVVVVILCVWNIIERHPRTDDAIVAANVIGVTPRVHGPIIKLNVKDNQDVKAGDVLFEIDPADYEQTLDTAKAALNALDQQIEVARSQDEELKFQVKAAAAATEQSQAELKQAEDNLQRLEPLLPKGFATANDVDKAHTAVAVATAALAAQGHRFNQVKATLSNLATVEAQRPGAVAAVNLATLQLSYCKYAAPFPGKVINLNISAGEYANAGVPLFALLDTQKWYVIANFREGELRRFANGSPADVYLLSAPRHHFAGKVQGIGWGVASKDQIDVSHLVPDVPRELNWVHIAQRFPVRIEVENPDPDLFRMGASADVTMK